MNEKTIELAKKIKALADRGIGGEKANAIELLEKFLQRNNLTIEQIEEVERSDRLFKVKKNQIRILLQIMRKVMGSEISFYQSARYRNGLIAECTMLEYVEIQAMFEFYWKAYEKELDIFTSAFIYKNELYANDKSRALSDLSREEKERFYKTARLMEGMDKNHYLKPIEQ